MTDSSSDGQLTANKGPMMMAVMWALTSVALILVAARLCVRTRILRNLGADDWLIALAMFFGVIFVATSTISVHYGYGQHLTRLSNSNAEKALMWNMISFIFGIVSFAIPKLAIAALLNRLLNPTSIQKIIMWSLTGMVSAIAFSNIILYLTECKPVEGIFKPLMVESGAATCRNAWILIHFATFNGAFSAFVDLYLATYPGYVLFHLQMSLRKKIALSTALGLGSVAAATAIVKCTQLKGLADTSDGTYATVPLVIWTCVETNVCVIAACIPTLQPFMDWILKKMKLLSSHKVQYRSSQFDTSAKYGQRYASSSFQHPHARGGAVVEGPGSLSKRDSTERILDEIDLRHIRRTDEVHIDYETQH
ncbi:hypothetical protein N7528_008535 [Penicillium herquei]|nr:hypothetical protein N7528_008535 [Penicillium herquei]